LHEALAAAADAGEVDGEVSRFEERPAAEVTHLAGRPITPMGVAVRHPAFDVTPHRFVSAIVCERGVARPPYTKSLRALAGRLP